MTRKLPGHSPAIRSPDLDAICTRASKLIRAREYSEAVPLLRVASRFDEPWAQFELGCLADYGYGIRQSDRMARYWYRRAAGQGDTSAMVNLGIILANPMVGKRDYPAAALLFRRAAARGHPKAFYNLGMYYYKGLGVRQSLQRAADHMRRALRLGFKPAAAKLRQIERERRSSRRAS